MQVSMHNTEQAQALRFGPSCHDTKDFRRHLPLTSGRLYTFPGRENDCGYMRRIRPRTKPECAGFSDTLAFFLDSPQSRRESGTRENPAIDTRIWFIHTWSHRA